MSGNIVACPHCRKNLSAPDSLLGKPVKCPSCGQPFTFTIPAPSPSADPARQPNRTQQTRPKPAPQPSDKPAPTTSRRMNTTLLLGIGLASSVALAGFALSRVTWTTEAVPPKNQTEQIPAQSDEAQKEVAIEEYIHATSTLLKDSAEYKQAEDNWKKEYPHFAAHIREMLASSNEKLVTKTHQYLDQVEKDNAAMSKRIDEYENDMAASAKRRAKIEEMDKWRAMYEGVLTKLDQGEQGENTRRFRAEIQKEYMDRLRKHQAELENLQFEAKQKRKDFEAEQSKLRESPRKR